MQPLTNEVIASAEDYEPPFEGNYIGMGRILAMATAAVAVTAAAAAEDDDDDSSSLTRRCLC